MSSSPPGTKENVGLAFALVIGAGLSTALGASVVFVPRLVAYAQQSTLAAGLGLSAGVMVYVSFVEIFQKSRNAFSQAGFDDASAYAYATLCFFGGVLLMELLNSIVSHFHHRRPSAPSSTTTTPNHRHGPQSGNGEPITIGGCCSKTVDDWEVLRQMGASLARGEDERSNHQNSEGSNHGCCNEHNSGGSNHGCCVAVGVQNCCGEDSPINDLPIEDPPFTQNVADHLSDNSGDHEEGKREEESSHESNRPPAEEDRQLLMRMSINTAVAIGLHNFPEGLATFVATLHDPTVGAVLAVAIAIHNIPEGLCVALPIYYATGSRRKALFGALLSGLSEPFAAVLGYIVLAQAVSYTTYAILFGVVAGMMVMISTRELLPTAHRYDPDDRVVTYAFIFGMAVMALSLVLFVI